MNGKKTAKENGSIPCAAAGGVLILLHTNTINPRNLINFPQINSITFDVHGWILNLINVALFPIHINRATKKKAREKCTVSVLKQWKTVHSLKEKHQRYRTREESAERN